MAEDLQSKAAEIARKILTVGVGAVFLTEESIRNLVSELKIPKELLSNLLESAGKTKNEFFAKLSQDLLTQLRGKVNAEELIRDMLEHYEIDLHVKMNFKPKAGKSRKPTKSDSHSNRSSESEADEDDSDNDALQ